LPVGANILIMNRSINYRIVLMAVSVVVLFDSNYSSGADWVLARQENFNLAGQLQDQQTFGDRGWLTTRIRNGGSVEVTGGHALISTPDFADSALVRITPRLPAEYKLRLRIGEVHYSVANYEQADYDNPDFKYDVSWVENGFYWLTLTDRPVQPDSGEDWWHRYRKIVIDSDDHTGVTRPLYMVYMNPDLDRSSGDWLNGQAALLRCWSAGQWHTENWNWEVAFAYEDSANYEVEIEKSAGQLIMRAFDSSGILIEETDPLDFDLIYAMSEGSTASEYAYFGEPHIDSYEGDAWIDDIRLWVVNSAPELQMENNYNAGINEQFSLSIQASDTTFLDSLTFSSPDLPDGAVLDNATGLFTWTPSEAQRGDHSVTFIVEDEYGASDSIETTVTVGDFSSAAITARGGCGKIDGNSNCSILSVFIFSSILLFVRRASHIFS
jgi:hypothetical protein